MPHDARDELVRIRGPRADPRRPDLAGGKEAGKRDARHRREQRARLSAVLSVVLGAAAAITDRVVRTRAASLFGGSVENCPKGANIGGAEEFPSQVSQILNGQEGFGPALVVDVESCKCAFVCTRFR